MHVSSISSKTIHKADCPLPVADRHQKTYEDRSTPADLLFPSHDSSECRLGFALMEGQDGDAGLNAEELPRLIFSHCLADATKPFNHATTGPSNSHGMRAALALPQE